MTVGSADVVVDGQVIESADISEISIDPISGDINITAGGLYTVTKDGNPPPGPNVVINSLTASDTVILVGESITISWSTTDADSCTPSGGDGGWDSEVISLPSGTSSSLTMATSGSFNFRLDCSNDTPSQTFRTVTVQVNDDVDPPNPSNCPDPALTGGTRDWATHFGTNWPDPAYAEVVTAIGDSSYLALEFNTGNIVEDGGFTTITHTSTSGIRLGAISECPGDFVDHLPDAVGACTEEFFIGGSVKWNTNSGYQFGQCNLEPNTTYYLNLTFTDGLDPQTNRCVSSSACRTILRVWH
ncbi:MAG: hypothetical protein HKO64_06595 [Xanthomonadales bacterium]|nr:hypothetical protein [Xanthomonadales bacterium]